MKVFRMFSVALAVCLSAGCGGADPKVTPPSSAKQVTTYGFRALTETGTIDGTAITVTVPYGTDVTGLIADFTLSAEASATINGVAQVSGVTANDFSHPVTFVVKAADGSTQSYTVTVRVRLSSAKQVTSFGFRALSEIGTVDGSAIKATVPYGTDVTVLAADFALSAGASASINGVAQVSGVTANDFTRPTTLVVKAADGSTQDYTVTVSVPDLVFAFGLQAKTDPNVTVPAMLRKGQITLLPVPNTRPNGQTAVVTFDGQDLYIPGYVMSGTSWSSQRPVLWKNGLRTDLPVGSAGDHAAAFQIIIDKSGNRYVQGRLHSSTQGDDVQPGYWSAPAGSDSWSWIPLEDFAGTTNSQGKADGLIVVLDNGDFYITGALKVGSDQPVYWKNGTPRQLPFNADTKNGGYAGGYANNLKVIGSDFYMFGRLYLGADQNYFRPVVWHWAASEDVQSAELTFLPTPTNETYGTDWGAVVDGTDVYAFGMLGSWGASSPAYWKNSGTDWQLITPEAIPGTTSGLANWMHPVSLAGLVGGDVYIDACVYDGARGVLAYWLNGKAVVLPTPSGWYGFSGENMSIAP